MRGRCLTLGGRASPLPPYAPTLITKSCDCFRAANLTLFSSRVNNAHTAETENKTKTETETKTKTTKIMATVLANLELLTEHFGYPPLSFIDDIINAVNEVSYQATAGLERFVASVQASTQDTEQAMHQVETLMEAAIDRNFDMFELFALRNVFNIPAGPEGPDGPTTLHVALTHHKGLDLSVTKEQEEQFDSQLQQMREKLATARAFQALLRKHQSRLAQRRAKIENVQKHLGFLVDEARKVNVYPIQSTEMLLSDQLTAAHSLLLDLGSKISFEGGDAAIAKIISNQGTERARYINRMVSRKVNLGFAGMSADSLQAEADRMQDVGRLQDLEALESMLVA